MENRRTANISGIDKHWVEGQDDRVELAKVSGLPRDTIDRCLDALWAVVSSRARTKFVGIGVFEWRAWNRNLPTGRRVHAWHLTFKPGRYTAKYKGEKQ